MHSWTKQRKKFTNISRWFENSRDNLHIRSIESSKRKPILYRPNNLLYSYKKNQICSSFQLFQFKQKKSNEGPCLTFEADETTSRNHMSWFFRIISFVHKNEILLMHIFFLLIKKLNHQNTFHRLSGTQSNFMNLTDELSKNFDSLYIYIIKIKFPLWA